MEIIYRDKDNNWYVGDKLLDEVEIKELKLEARKLEENRFFNLVLNQLELAAKESAAIKAQNWEQVLTFRGTIITARHLRAQLKEFLK